ncbi:hypothetical protein Pla52n_36980 [Stieleria varia]|uniref:Protein nucleotidyltransferase YdiU n=2 Tax=Stieleria varia TaxID=2528005 RepID=A0A5C6ATA1_9BACT|nr:hypothetical protein Pla52n_36980 [Stieleria varia]
MLGMSSELVQSEDFAHVFGGNRVLEPMDPFAMCYGGHQFGNWAGQLGDGRAINMCEVVDVNGRRQTLQLKGAGPTPYSRSADGLAVLRSSVREFLCSEAMHHLGVPTTRALSLVATGESVMRDMFYDGNPRYEPGAVVCRVAPSFLRFGNFQIFASRDDTENLTKLLAYTIRNDFPELAPGSPTDSFGGDRFEPEVYAEWFGEVCRSTAEMIVHWMRVGFVHGVMNTDNMSILGLTIDYGPYGWLEDYDPHWTPNTTDAQGRRYCFGNQPQIAQWNLAQLAGALASFLGDDLSPLQAGLRAYVETFNQQWHAMMASKLGLESFDKETDEPLIEDLLGLLQLAETDMTIFFRQLSLVGARVDGSDTADALEVLSAAYYRTEQLTDEVRQKTSEWITRYRQRVALDGVDDITRRTRMNRVNPKYVLRNYLAQMAIDRSEQGDDSLIAELLDVLRNPYDEQPGRESFAEKRPEWARHRAGCSMLSCSS